MSGRIAQHFIQDLLERTNIADVVSAHVTIQLKGKDHSGCCPFHQEKTPSFTVSTEKQFYHCFGCGAHGNAIGFLMAIHHQSFPEAVQELAARAGLEVIYEGGNTHQQTAQYDTLYTLLSQASALFQERLPHNQQALSYLQSRGINTQAQQHFSIGYAPNDWHSLKPLNNSSTTEEQLLACGLMVDNKKRYDRFRDRIMFPIKNIQGKIVGFGGRSLGDAKPKYLNSPETPVFHKNQELYGLYEARQANPKLPYVIVVEGYMDVIALFQYQFPMGVATLGTAVNATHVKKILRYTKRMVICFDGDAAGQKASWKALLAILPSLTEGIDIKFLSLPDRQDPDSFLREHGRDAFKLALEKAPRLPEKLFNELELRYPLDHIAHQSQFAHEAFKCIQLIPEGFYHDLMINALADRLKLERKQLEQLTHKKDAHQPTQPPPSVTTHHGRIQIKPAIEQANWLLLHNPSLVQTIDNEFTVLETNTDELGLLNYLLITLREKPHLTTGQLFALLQTTRYTKYSSALASTAPPPENINHQDTIRETIAYLKQQQQQEKADQLLHRSKTEGLSLNEKKQLQQLLMQINENKIE